MPDVLEVDCYLSDWDAIDFTVKCSVDNFVELQPANAFIRYLLLLSDSFFGKSKFMELRNDIGWREGFR